MKLLSSLSISRRAVLQSLGAGVLLTAFSRAAADPGSALSVLPEAVEPTVAVGVAGLMQPFALPELPYAYDALAPHIDARTMEIHHSKHHLAYINAANKALEARPDLRELSAEQLIAQLDAFPEPLQTVVRNQVGGHLNHTFFWSILAPAKTYEAGALRAAIDRQFGSLEALQKEFGEAALKRFGSGWAWLVAQQGQLRVISTANQDSPLMQGAQPIIGLDVWEHAYYLEYQNRRADYVKAFWTVLNWDAAERNFANRVTL